jgi:hypothetical protein
MLCVLKPTTVHSKKTHTMHIQQTCKQSTFPVHDGACFFLVFFCTSRVFVVYFTWTRSLVCGCVMVLTFCWGHWRSSVWMKNSSTAPTRFWILSLSFWIKWMSEFVQRIKTLFPSTSNLSLSLSLSSVVLHKVPQVVCFFKEFWKWPQWLLFARASNLRGYNQKHGHLLTGYTKNKFRFNKWLLSVWRCGVFGYCRMYCVCE